MTRKQQGVSMQRSMPGTSLTAEWAAVAAQIGRLISDARMIGAVGQAGHGLTAAEEEVRAAGIADRPAAGHLVQLEQRTALPDRDDVVEDLRLGLDIVLVGVRERGVASHRRTRHPE